MERICDRGRGMSGLAACGSFLVFAGLLLAGPVRASAETVQEAPGIWTRSTLLGDIGGLRPALAKYGITFSLQEISEVLGNVSGGIKQGSAYDGVTIMSLGLDTSKALHWQGGAFNVSALQIHGRNLSADNLDNLQTVSGIVAPPSTRLWELWYQQDLMGGSANIKLGQQSIDQEFMASQYSCLYLNTMMGWPMLPSADLYAGGPVYPLSSLGIRLRAQPAKPLTVLFGVFDDNAPGGPFQGDSALRGREASGTRFNLDTGALFIGELQYAVNQTDAAAKALPGTYKLGAWYDTADFPDRRLDTAGLSLADPHSLGNARTHRGNYSIYGIIDQTVWSEGQGPRSVGLFARVTGAPADCNLIDFSLNAGVNLKAPLPGRDNDTFGIGYGQAHVGDSASDLDRDVGNFTNTSYPVRGTEQFVEITYQFQLTPWWQLQPDFQYVINPGGGVSFPGNPGQRLRNEAVIGLRTAITF